MGDVSVNALNINNMPLVAGLAPKEPKPDAVKADPASQTKDTVSIGGGNTFLSSLSNSADSLISSAKDSSIQLDNYIERHGPLKTGLRYIESFFKGLKAFPKFVYPTVTGGTEEETKFVLDIMDKLPLKDVNAVKRIEILPELADAAGLAYHDPTGPLVQLSRQQMQISDKWATAVTIHETGHAKDFETSLFGFFGHESKNADIWGKGPHISDYAETNHWEDFAESYANYHMNPEGLKEKCPDKFARLEKLEKTGFLEKLVDNKAFRETGRFMGEIFDKAPIVRQGLNIMSYLAGFIQVAKGAGELQQAKKTGDLRKKMNGTMDIAAGTCFASKLFCIPGLAIDGARQAMDRAIDKNQISAEAANAVVQNTIGAIGGPIAAISHWVKNIFTKKPKAVGAEASQAVNKPAEPKTEKIPWRTIAKAVGIGVGGATGSVAGGIIGPYTGVLLGFALAGPVGGFAGMIAGAIAGINIGNRIGGSLGSLVGGRMQKNE